MNVQSLSGKTVAFCASGGLDSCVTTHWLTNRGVDVVTFTADLGQPDETDLNLVAEKMKSCGAVEAIIVPLKEQIAEAGLTAVQAQAQYEGSYWNTTPIGRYVTVQGLVPHILEHGIDIMSHGATGRGNDQIRFQLIANMIAPQLQVYAPWRDEYFLDEFRGREEMLEYCEKNGLPIPNKKSSLYSTDANLLGLTHEAGELEEITTPANFVTPGMGVKAVDAPDEVETISITFDKGRPVSINGEQVPSMGAVFEKLNEIGGRNAIGINLHLVENRFVGTKSRGVYEAPGIELLGSAYAYMLQLILDRRTLDLFEFNAHYLGKQMYQAYGLDLGSQLATDMSNTVAQYVSGTITLDLYKGGISFASATNVQHSLYIEENASMSAVGSFDHADSEGLLQVLGVSAKAASAQGQVRQALHGS